MNNPSSIVSAPPPVQSAALERLKRLVDVAVIFLAVLYLSGWSYLYGYYKSFGIGMNELSQPSQPTLVFGMIALHAVSHWMVIVSIVVGFAALEFLSGWKPFIATVGYLLIALLCVYPLSVASMSAGVTVAKRDAGPDSHLPNVRITPVANGRIQAADQVSDCAQILDNGAPSRGYNLLLRANGKTYVVFPRKAENRDLRGSVVVCGIEDNQIRSIEIQAGFR